MTHFISLALMILGVASAQSLLADALHEGLNITIVDSANPGYMAFAQNVKERLLVWEKEDKAKGGEAILYHKKVVIAIGEVTSPYGDVAFRLIGHNPASGPDSIPFSIPKGIGWWKANGVDLAIKYLVHAVTGVTGHWLPELPIPPPPIPSKSQVKK